MESLPPSSQLRSREVQGREAPPAEAVQEVPGAGVLEGDALEVNTFLVVNVILSSLQAYWTKLIIEGLVKLLKGDPTADDVGKDN